MGYGVVGRERTESTAYPNPLKKKSRHCQGVIPISSSALLMRTIFFARIGSTREESYTSFRKLSLSELSSVWLSVAFAAVSVFSMSSFTLPLLPLEEAMAQVLYQAHGDTLYAAPLYPWQAIGGCLAPTV